MVPIRVPAGAGAVEDRDRERHVERAGLARLEPQRERRRGGSRRILAAVVTAGAWRNCASSAGQIGGSATKLERGASRKEVRAGKHRRRRVSERLGNGDGEYRERGGSDRDEGEREAGMGRRTTADLSRGLRLEDQRGTHTHDTQVRVVALEEIELTLERDLMSGIERAGDRVGGPRFIDKVILGTGRVSANRGGVDERWDYWRGQPRGTALAAGHVDTVRDRLGAAGLDQRGEMDNGVGAAKQRERDQSVRCRH